MKRALGAALAAVLLTTATQALPADAAGGGKSKAKFTGTSYVAGAGAVSVKGKAPGGRRTVKLQVRTRGGWVTLKSKRTKKNGRYALSVPLDWYGTHKVRVLAQGRGGFSKTKKIAVSPGYAPVGAGNDWALLRSSTGTSYSFDPCRTVKYKVNVAQVDPANLALVQRAVAQIGAATGIKTKYTGTTDIVPSLNPSAKFPGKTNLVVAFGNNSQAPQFAAGQADGLGGPRYARNGRTKNGKRVAVTTQAGVTLQTEGYVNYTQGFESTGKPGIGNLMLHEIGHAFGLDHSRSGDEMMAAAAWTPDPDGVYRSRYGAGDLTGLKKVGLTQGCLSGSSSYRSAEFLVPAELTQD